MRFQMESARLATALDQATRTNRATVVTKDAHTIDSLYQVSLSTERRVQPFGFLIPTSVHYFIACSRPNKVIRS
jgi:hypothetical protein